MSEKFCVYEHVFPNGKKYIGITSDAEKRWRNGKGYENQGKIANAIKHFGWEHVKHEIIVDGLNKEQAKALERYLIKELDTIRRGYNTAPGGDNINGTFLSPYVMAMIRSAKRYPQFDNCTLVIIADGARYDAAVASWYNEAARAVTLKHGRYSTTSLDGAIYFWHCMEQYFLLDKAIKRGEDVSAWEEIRPQMEGKHE